MLSIFFLHFCSTISKCKWFSVSCFINIIFNFRWSVLVAFCKAFLHTLQINSVVCMQNKGVFFSSTFLSFPLSSSYNMYILCIYIKRCDKNKSTVVAVLKRPLTNNCNKIFNISFHKRPLQEV